MEGIINLVLMFGVIFAIMYFLMIRPQRKQEEKRQAMVKALKKNDKVMTAGGIYGVVRKVNEDTVVLRVDDSKGIQITFSHQAILGVVDDDDDDNKDKKS